VTLFSAFAPTPPPPPTAVCHGNRVGPAPRTQWE
jgi:hypothetical protein